MSILVEILDPPIIQDIGFVISEVILVRASISKSICNPENEGRNLEILTIEACEPVSYTHLTLPTTPYV